MPQQSLDPYELQMLAELQQNGRISVSDLAASIGLSATPCARRFERLKQDQIIRGFAAIIDRKALGLNLEVFVQVSLLTHSDNSPAEFRRAIAEREEVTACWALTGDQDFMLHVMVPDVDALNAFLMDYLLKLPGVRDVKSNLVLENIKEPHKVPLRHIQPR